MKLIIIIPAYNEEKTIADVIAQIPRNIEGINEIKIFVINDGSADNTKKIALASSADRIIDNKKNLGLARTFQAGLLAALKEGADIIINTDADGQYNQEQIPELIKPILEKRSDIVIGDRQIKKLEFMKRGNKYGNLFGSWVIRKLTGTKVKDASSGFRAFSREAALKLNVLYNHTYTHETIIQAVYKNITIGEVPIEFSPRTSGNSKLIKNLFAHIKHSSIIIIRTILSYKPLKILFYAGIVVMTPGILLGIRFIIHFLYGEGGGKTQSLILSAIFIILGFFIIILGLIGDIISNNRKINEEILYYLKKSQNDK